MSGGVAIKVSDYFFGGSNPMTAHQDPNPEHLPKPAIPPVPKPDPKNPQPSHNNPENAPTAKPDNQ